MRVTACVPICEIGNDSGNNGFYLQGSGTVPIASTAYVADINPYSMFALNSASTFGDANWISPHIPLLALAFDRYSVNSLAFHYQPQSTTTVEDRLVFAWTDDPSHPFLSASGALITSTVTNQLGLLITKDSVPFMPWKEWRLSVPVARDMRFMYQATAQDDQTTSSRWAQFGAMSCIGSAAPTVPVLYGVLYIEIVLDLMDPVPIIASVNSLLPLFHSARKSARHRKVVSLDPRDESKEEKKRPFVPPPLVVSDGWDGADPSPPPSTRPPTSAPGGTAYVSRAKPPSLK